MMKVLNFMFWNNKGALLDNYAKFDAEFVEWSDEADITLCKISTGETIKIPVFALEGFKPEDYPKQVL